MKNNNKQSEPMSDSLFFFGIIVLFIAIGWNKYKFDLLRLIIHYRLLVALIITITILAIYLKLKSLYYAKRMPVMIENEVLGKSDSEDSVFAGYSDKGKRVLIKPSMRKMHTQIVGTTNAGKTESVILPWAIDDMKNDRGLLIIDGKSDRSLLDKLYGYAKKHNRESEFKILSLCEEGISNTFNPLANGSPLEVTERVFKALNFENEYYKSLQYEVLLQTLLIFQGAKIIPTPIKVIEALRSPKKLEILALKIGNPNYLDWVVDFSAKSREQREQQTSGLVTQLQVLAVGETAAIFNSETSDIDLEKALDEGHIIYCQLPVLKIPTLGKTVGKLVLQNLQSAVASRHLGSAKNNEFFSVYLDDFTEYLTDSFVSLLNKSRSANVSIVFAHQALGDLGVLGDGVKNTILTNANLKVFMRTNEPDSAEYFSKTIGTIQGLKLTERQKAGTFGSSKTGDGSVRDVEEFKFHPNLFKQELGIGEAVMILPHERGSLPVKLKFRMMPNLGPQRIPETYKSAPLGLPLAEGLSGSKESEVKSNATPNSENFNSAVHLIHNQPPKLSE